MVLVGRVFSGRVSYLHCYISGNYYAVIQSSRTVVLFRNSRNLALPLLVLALCNVKIGTDPFNLIQALRKQYRSYQYLRHVHNYSTVHLNSVCELL